jgi:hypothetical protein
MTNPIIPKRYIELPSGFRRLNIEDNDELSRQEIIDLLAEIDHHNKNLNLKDSNLESEVKEKQETINSREQDILKPFGELKDVPNLNKDLNNASIQSLPSPPPPSPSSSFSNLTQTEEQLNQVHSNIKLEKDILIPCSTEINTSISVIPQENREKLKERKRESSDYPNPNLNPNPNLSSNKLNFLRNILIYRNLKQSYIEFKKKPNGVKAKYIGILSLIILSLGSSLVFRNKELNRENLESREQQASTINLSPQELNQIPVITTQLIKDISRALVENIEPLLLSDNLLEVPPHETLEVITRLDSGVIKITSQQSNSNNNWTEGNNWVRLEINSRKIPIVENINPSGEYKIAYINSIRVASIPKELVNSWNLDSNSKGVIPLKDLNKKQKGLLPAFENREVIFSLNTENKTPILKVIKEYAENNLGVLLTNRLGDALLRGAIDTEGNLMSGRFIQVSLRHRGQSLYLMNPEHTGTLQIYSTIFEGLEEEKPKRFKAIFIANTLSPNVQLIIFELDSQSSQLTSKNGEITFEKIELTSLNEGEELNLGKIHKQGSIEGQMFQFTTISTDNAEGSSIKLINNPFVPSFYSFISK